VIFLLAIGLALAAAYPHGFKLASTRERELIQAAHEINLTLARYEVDSDGVAPSTFAACSGLIDELPQSPYTGKPMEEHDIHSAKGYVGNFSYLLQGAANRRPLYIVVAYAPSRPFAKSGLIPIGGDCSGDEQFLARGVTPAETLAKLTAMCAAPQEFDYHGVLTVPQVRPLPPGPPAPGPNYSR